MSDKGNELLENDGSNEIVRNDEYPRAELGDTHLDEPDQNDDEAEKPAEIKSWSYYLHPDQVAPLMSRRLLVFGSYNLLYYLIQLTAAVGVVNFYCDIDRFNSCGGLSPLDSASVYDKALLLLAIYHIIEWVKSTILLTVVFLGGVMRHLMYVWFLLELNTIFGIVCVVYSVLVRYSEDGEACAVSQPFRAQWLFVEIVGFVVLFFIYPGPILPLLFCSKQSHQ